MKWKAHKHPTYGTMYTASSEREGWQIVFPRRAPEQPTVELRYGRRQEGDVAVHMLDIGRFASAAEAMLAVRMFKEGDVHPNLAAVRADLGFQPYFDGAEKLDLRTDRKSDGQFLFCTGVGKNKREVALEYEPPGRGKPKTHKIARIWSSTMFDAQFIPADTPETAQSVETAILTELLRIRMERGPGRYTEPMTVGEFAQWADTRYGQPVDPDADRPYVRAEPEVRNAAARDLLLGNAVLQARLGISPGYEERVAGHTDGFDDFIDEMILAKARGAGRAEILDMLDARTLEIESRPAFGPR